MLGLETSKGFHVKWNIGRECKNENDEVGNNHQIQRTFSKLLRNILNFGVTVANLNG